MPNQSPIICILGPTACGKTDLSLALAQRLPIEIMNVDSAQIYRHMDIGSGKPDQTIRQAIPHHLMDILDPLESYSAGQFTQDANVAIKQIISHGKIPVLVGGTMLYFKALQQGLSTLPGSSPVIRQALTQQLHENGLQALYQRLQAIDPQRATQIKPTDPQRIQRALEIYEMTGKTMTEWLLTPATTQHDFTFINIGMLPITTPRAVLHERIALRFDQMLAAGLVDEVNNLFTRGDLHLSLPALRAVGYRQVWKYLSGEMNYELMRENAIAATRQLAKRQLTWLRSWPDLVCFDFQDKALVEKVALIL